VSSNERRSEDRSAHIIHFVTSNVVAMENSTRGSNDFEIQIIQQHLVAHDSVVGIHPSDGCLEGFGNVVHLNDVSDLLMRINLRLHDMELEDVLNSRVGKNIRESDSTKALKYVRDLIEE
jgi:hypothetical protein